MVRCRIVAKKFSTRHLQTGAAALGPAPSGTAVGQSRTSRLAAGAIRCRRSVASVVQAPTRGARPRAAPHPIQSAALDGAAGASCGAGLTDPANASSVAEWRTRRAGERPAPLSVAPAGLYVYHGVLGALRSTRLAGRHQPCPSPDCGAARGPSTACSRTVRPATCSHATGARTAGAAGASAARSARAARASQAACAHLTGAAAGSSRTAAASYRWGPARPGRAKARIDRSQEVPAVAADLKRGDRDNRRQTDGDPNLAPLRCSHAPVWHQGTKPFTVRARPARRARIDHSGNGTGTPLDRRARPSGRRSGLGMKRGPKERVR